MKEEYSIFRRFSDLNQAKELQFLLEENKIRYVLDDNVPPVDVTFTGGGAIQNQIEIRIKESDFEKTEKLLEKHSEKLIEEIDKNYYLFDFADDELYEILLKSDEWNKFDYTLAQKILKDRGKSIDEKLLTSLKEKRIDELAKPESNQQSWIIAGYIFALLGGALGLIIGYFLWTSKKTLPNGCKVFSYSEKDRIHGKYIFYISIIVFPISLISRILKII